MAEAGELPDRVIKAGIELRLRTKLRHEARGGPAALNDRKQQLPAAPDAGLVTTHVDAANRQHDEEPPAFFRLILGPHLRYSCCYLPSSTADLAAAELAASDQTVKRARIGDVTGSSNLGRPGLAVAVHGRTIPTETSSVSPTLCSAIAAGE